MPETRTSGDVTYRCQYRATWCTKYRRPVIDGEVESRLRGIVEAVCAERGAQPTRLDILGDGSTWCSNVLRKSRSTRSSRRSRHGRRGRCVRSSRG